MESGAKILTAKNGGETMGMCLWIAHQIVCDHNSRNQIAEIILVRPFVGTPAIEIHAILYTVYTRYLYLNNTIFEII